MVGDDFDAFAKAVEQNCGPVTWSTTHHREQRWPTLRAAARSSGPVLVRPESEDEGGRTGAWFLPPRLLDDDTLRGGHVSHAFTPTELARDAGLAGFIASIRKAMTDSTHPWIRRHDGRAVRRYRIGDAAADWYRAHETRVLRDESSPFLSYELAYTGTAPGHRVDPS